MCYPWILVNETDRLEVLGISADESGMVSGIEEDFLREHGLLFLQHRLDLGSAVASLLFVACNFESLDIICG